MREPPAGPRVSNRTLLAVPAILLASLLAYANSFHGELVFDDWSSIRDNPHVRDLRSYLPGGEGYRSQPNRWIGNLSFALNYALGGLDVTGYHVVNLAIHAVNGLLVFALVVLTFRTARLARSALADSAGAVALAAALLFTTHPLQAQAVTYIVQRLASLATLFYLLTVVLYARWRLAGDARPAWRRLLGYLPVLAAAVLAMRTKETSFTLPFAVAAWELVFLEGGTRRRLAYLLPIMAAALLIPLTLIGTGRPMAEVLSVAERVTRIETEMSRWDYLVTQFAVIVTYLRLLVLPVGQNLDHDYPLYRSLLEPKVLGSLAMIVALVLVAAQLLRRTSVGAARPLDPAARLVSFGIVWFFLGLSVECSVIPIVDLVYEHRVYLPSVGFFVAVAAGGALLARRYAPSPGRPVLSAAAALSAVLAAATFQRNRVWASPLTLWSDAVEKSPRKTRPHSNLGLALIAAGRREEALPHLRAVVQINPNHVSGYNNLAVLLGDMGRTGEAVHWLEVARGLKPDHAETYYNLGRIRLEEGRLVEAAELLRKAIALDPGYVNAYANLGGALNQLGRPAETVQLLAGKDALLRGSVEACFNLGVAYVLLGDGPGAEQALSSLTRLAPDRAAQLGEFARARGLR